MKLSTRLIGGGRCAVLVVAIVATSCDGSTGPDVGDVPTFVALALAESFTCGLSTTGQAYCWGSGNRTRAQGFPEPIGGALRFVDIDAQGMTCFGCSAAEHACAVTSEGTAYCWGYNTVGELGDGSFARRLDPVRVAGNLPFTQIVVGSRHTCARTDAGNAHCWGTNNSGELGNGTGAGSNTPTPVASALSFISLVAGENHTCGLVASGDAYCWGGNVSGQLGDGTTTARHAPVAVLGGFQFAALVAGGQ
jgi:alpha-tubulin suppressor-like RCC1 family protein